MSVEVSVQTDGGVALPLPAERVEAVVLAVLASEEVAEAEVSVTFLDDAGIAALNERYLGHEGPTDVISFPMRTPDESLVGDVYVGVEQARRQAEELGVALEEELLRLAIHGALHVIGYEHPEDAEARAASPMYRRQEEILSAFLRDAAREP